MIPSTQQFFFSSSFVTVTTCFGPKTIFRWYTAIYCHIFFCLIYSERIVKLFKRFFSSRSQRHTKLKLTAPENLWEITFSRVYILHATSYFLLLSSLYLVPCFLRQRVNYVTSLHIRLHSYEYSATICLSIWKWFSVLDWDSINALSLLRTELYPL
jgi:hypothetical protein